jgi:hypothetical protein
VKLLQRVVKRFAVVGIGIWMGYFRQLEIVPAAPWSADRG